jgi:hypothetical protein
MRPPGIGKLLPRGRDAWYEERKWTDWILSREGHGPDWAAVAGVHAHDRDVLWVMITAALADAPVYRIDAAADGGLTYGVRFNIRFRDRGAHVITAWHVRRPGDAPRLVTAYPRPYTRDRGHDL